jgi:Leucine-rich repeat (LRR) protein
MSESLGMLSGLEVMDLSNNRLRGAVPPTYGNLSRLTHLVLSTNSLNSTIPDLGNLLGLS